MHQCHDSSISLLSLHEEGTNQRQTTDDPQIPAPAPVRSHPAVPPPHPSAQIQTSTIQAAPRERSNYRLRHTFRGHTQSVSAVKFSPDGSLLASCGVSALCVCLGFLYAWSCSRLVICFATMIKVWSPFTGELIRNLSGHTKGLSDISWLSNRTYLASASDDTNTRIWNVETARQQNIYGVIQASCSASTTTLRRLY